MVIYLTDSTIHLLKGQDVLFTWVSATVFLTVAIFDIESRETLGKAERLKGWKEEGGGADVINLR